MNKDYKHVKSRDCTHVGRVGHGNAFGESEQVEQSDFVPFVQIQKLVRADPLPVELRRCVLPIYNVLQLQPLTLHPWSLIGRGE